MIVAGIGLLLGLVMLFFGMALIEQDRKDKKKQREQQAQAVAEANDAETMAEALVDAEEQPTFASIRRVKLGAFLVAQGALMTIVAIALFVINAYVVELKWYVSVPVVVLVAVLSVITDAFMMGDPEAAARVAAEEAAAEEDAQKTQECTEITQEEAAIITDDDEEDGEN